MIRRTRLVAFAAWLGVSLLTIAGFAVFSTRPVPTTSSTSTSVAMGVAAGRGGVAGRLAASAFSPVVTPPPTTTSTTIASAELASTSESTAPPETTPPDTTPPETEPPETTTPPEMTTTTTEPPQTTEPPTTAVPPTTVAPGADPPPPSPLSEAEMSALAAVYFTGDDVDKALQVSYCESQWDASAYNPLSGASGLFQHLPGGWEERAAGAGFAGASPFDAEANTAAAAWLVYQGGGWWHWDGRCAVDG